MFVDLVNSTALGSTLDPEEMSELLQAFRYAVAAAVERFDGHVAKYMVRWCARLIPGTLEPTRMKQSAQSGLDWRRPRRCKIYHRSRGTLKARVGVATGPVVVGELIGEGAAREHTVVGDTPNLAARLQGLADPGSAADRPSHPSVDRRLIRCCRTRPLFPERSSSAGSGLACYRRRDCQELLRGSTPSWQAALLPFVASGRGICIGLTAGTGRALG